uniref:Enoyl-CoA hydratase n=1 Tax=Acrobeloides nanus TaxID=290746 RepID=A0A914ENK0_9BILA
MVDLYRKAIDELKFDKHVRAVIIKSDVPGAFCSGADLKERREMPVEEVPKFVYGLRQLTNDIASLPFPVIAAIEGFALGGGLELALACDIRVANKDAKMGLTETKLAIIPGAGGTQRLTRAVGLSRAKELIFTGRMIAGEEAARIGLVSHAVEKDAFGKALEIGKEILKTGPIAVRLAKIAVDQGAQMDINSALTVEQQCYAQVIPTQDRVEALKAFAEKRSPIFKGE